MTIPAPTVAMFKPGKELSVRVNGAGEHGAGETAGAQPSDGSAKVHGWEKAECSALTGLATTFGAAPSTR
jgi:hypothetical protein